MTIGDPISVVRERVRRCGERLLLRLFCDPRNRRRLLRAAPAEERGKIEAFFKALDDDRGPASRTNPGAVKET